MIRNYLKIAFRNLVRHKAFSIINISGLSIGMASSILILLWVWDEQSYDRFHQHAGQIYRLNSSAEDFKTAVSPAGAAAGLESQMPEIKNAVRISKPVSALLEAENHKFQEKRILYADSSFLEVFSFPLIRGDKQTAMLHPDAVLITEDMARKYFGQEDAMGKMIRKNNQENLIVTGILANVPSNSHLQFDFVIPMAAAARQDNDIKNSTWTTFNFYTYLLLDKQVTRSALLRLCQQIDKIYHEHAPEYKIDFQLQPVTDIHLRSTLQLDLPGRGNIQYVNIFFVVAFFILAVACINFMNLSTARSARRAKEVGLRKVIGAGRHQLIGQFLGESLLIAAIAFLAALLLVWVLLPAFNELAGKKLALQFSDGTLLFSLLGIALATGLIAGIYPALYLSGFQPAKVLKGKLRAMGGNLIFRNALVVTQFTVSIILLVGTTVVYNQLNFIKNRNLGFDKQNLLYMHMTGDLWDKLPALHDALKGNPNTSNYTMINQLPTNLATGTIDVQWAGKDPKLQVVIPSMDVSESFLAVFQIKLLNGRFFSTAFRGDSSNYVVNEQALRVMGMQPATAVGQSLAISGRKGSIIGVVKDFNFKPVQQAIEPLVLRPNNYGGFVVIRTLPGHTEASIRDLTAINKRLNPSYPPDYSFIDQDLANLYQGEQRMGSLFNVFAVLAIFISFLGLYGLSAFIAEQRTREIGVRKVLGASIFNIVYLLSSNFTRLILLAIIIAIPLAWYGANSWLKEFAYRVDVGWGVFLTAAIVAILIAWVTVSFESVKSAIANPVKSLKAE